MPQDKTSESRTRIAEVTAVGVSVSVGEIPLGAQDDNTDEGNRISQNGNTRRRTLRLVAPGPLGVPIGPTEEVGPCRNPEFNTRIVIPGSAAKAFERQLFTRTTWRRVVLVVDQVVGSICGLCR